MNQDSHTLHNQIKELNHFYQEVIMDHFKHPRFKGHITDCRFCQEGRNPLCGDNISIYCKILTNNGTCCANQNCNNYTLEIYFEGTGCSISLASTSIMCELVQNKNIKEIKDFIKHAEQMYTGKYKINHENMTSDLDAIHGISQFPARIKCAALPWKTLECLIAENFDINGFPISKSCEKKVTNLKQGKKLKIVSTETQ